MKRLRRWMFNLAAGVSLVLCVASLSFWVRSYFVFDEFMWIGRDANRMILIPRGAMVYACNKIPPAAQQRPFRYGAFPPQAFLPVAGPAIDFSTLAGFAYRNNPALPSFVPHYFIQIPFWFVTIVTVAWPAIRFRKYRRNTLLSRRRKLNQCTKCGYDLRATPDRCPECGTAPAEAKGATP